MATNQLLDIDGLKIRLGYKEQITLSRDEFNILCGDYAEPRDVYELLDQLEEAEDRINELEAELNEALTRIKDLGGDLV